MEIDDINCHNGVHCVFSTLVSVYQHFNKSVNEPIVFMNCDRELTFEIKDADTLKNVILSNHLGRIATDFYEKNDIHISLKKFNYGLADFIKYVHSCVKKGYPVAVFLKSEYLKYNRVFKDSDNKHCVLIIGFEKNGFIFADSFIPTFPSTCYKGTIEYEDFYTAWSKSNKLYYEIDYESLRREIPLESVKEKMSKHTLGLSAVDAIAEFVRNIPQLYSEDEIRRNLKYFNFKINYDSILPLRKLLLKCLIYMEENDAELDFREEKNCLESIVSSWYSVELSLLRCTLRPEKENFLKVSKIIYKINENEKVLSMKIKQILSRNN